MADSDIIDSVEFVKDIIKDNYASVASFTQNSDTPRIVNGYFQKKFNFARYSGGIWVYEPMTGITKYNNYGARKRKDIVWSLSIDIMFKSRNYMLSNVTAIRRILEVNSNVRKIPPASGYVNCFNLLYEVSHKEKTNKFDNTHRFILDVELTGLGIVRATQYAA